jgi:hypothetical protein
LGPSAALGAARRRGRAGPLDGFWYLTDEPYFSGAFLADTAFFTLANERGLLGGYASRVVGFGQIAGGDSIAAQKPDFNKSRQGWKTPL